MEKEWPITCPCCGLVTWVHSSHPLYGKDVQQLDLFAIRQALEVWDEEEADDPPCPAP